MKKKMTLSEEDRKILDPDFEKYNSKEYIKLHRDHRISTLYDGSTGEKNLMETFLSMRNSGELGKEEIEKIEETYQKTGNPCLGVIVRFMEKEKNAEKEELL